MDARNTLIIASSFKLVPPIGTTIRPKGFDPR
jgi:hypothetical protein